MNRLSRAARAALVTGALLGSPHDLATQRDRTDDPPALATLPAMRAQPPAREGGGAERPAAPARPERMPDVEPAVHVRTEGIAVRVGPPTERWEDIGPGTVERAVRLPVGPGHTGPSVLRVQVLLNRAFFSAGMLDGRWGRNTQNAVLWFQAREGLPTTGIVDSLTHARLEQLGGAGPTAVEVTLTEEDVRGPFVAIPGDIYAHARLRCSCYESLSEKLTELFRTRLELLQRLNPGVRLNQVSAGARLLVPALRDEDARPGEVRQIVVSGSGNYLQALDAEGRILYHFAATLGSTVDPSPQGRFTITSVHPNPWWHYQPRLLAHVANDRPNAMIPPGPNNAVGLVWMSLSAPHYGIHGTRSPETIGYAQSAGCVRLTNWDAVFLGQRVVAGTPVAFRDTRRGAAPAPRADPLPTPAPRGPRLLGVPVDSVGEPPAEPSPAPPPPAPADEPVAVPIPAGDEPGA
jgi:lipoprotein-anchoring transpeptidase ErfK/SrfK